MAAMTATPLLGVRIERVFVPVGQSVPGIAFTSLAQPATASGGGDFQTVINAACDLWEQALQDDFTLTLYFAWAATSSGRAEHYGLTFAGNPVRETSGSILFDATPGGTYRFYIDPTPDTNEEFRSYGEDWRDHGGGPIIVARTFSAPVGAAADPGRHDLLSIAVHEIGHALGLSYSHPAFRAISGSGMVPISAPRPFVGTVLPLAENGLGVFTSHLDGPDYEQFVMGLGEGTPTMRFLPTEGDILALAQLSQFEAIDLDPHPVTATYVPELAVDYFRSDQPFTTFAGFSQQTPAAHGTAERIRFLPNTKPWPGLDSRFAQNWGARFIGAVRIATAGVHTFHFTHDGGIRLTLGQVAVVQPRGTIDPPSFSAIFAQDTQTAALMWHPGVEREDNVRVWLDAGYHHFVLEYADNDGLGGCVVAWSGPGFAKQLLPASALFRPAWAEITGPPVVTAPPQPLRLAPGASGQLHVEALALPAPTYQWRKDGVALPGATAATLAFAAATPADSGLYDCLLTNAGGTAVSAAAPVAVIGAAPGRPVNFSVRGPAGTGENTLIGGFVITGDPAAKKTVLIRVAGPALARFDVSGYLADPALQVFDQGGALLAANEDWDVALADNFAAVEAFGWTPGSKDAALQLALPPGEYTVHAVNRSGHAAEVLIEIYDASEDAATSLANCSCRTFVGPDAPLIAGLVLDAPGTLLVRHAGPALAPFGIANFARNPSLRLFTGNRGLTGNDDWHSSLAPVFAQARAFPWEPDSTDAATVLAAPAGAYTIHCHASSPGGVTLVELYTTP